MLNAICEKVAHFGNNRSHSYRRSNAIWKANVKSVKVKAIEELRRCMYVLLLTFRLS